MEAKRGYIRRFPSWQGVATLKGSYSLPRRPRFCHYMALCLSSEGSLQPPYGPSKPPRMDELGGWKNDYSRHWRPSHRMGFAAPRNPSLSPPPLHIQGWREGGRPGHGIQSQRRVLALPGARASSSPDEVRELMARKQQQPGNTTPETQETAAPAPRGEGDGEGRPGPFRENAEPIGVFRETTLSGGKRQES